MAHSGEKTDISRRPLKGVQTRCWEGRNIGPFAGLPSWRLTVFLGSGLILDGVRKRLHLYPILGHSLLHGRVLQKYFLDAFGHQQ